MGIVTIFGVHHCVSNIRLKEGMSHLLYKFFIVVAVTIVHVPRDSGKPHSILFDNSQDARPVQIVTPDR